MKRPLLLLPLLALCVLSAGCADLAFWAFSNSTRMSNGRIYPRSPSFSIGPFTNAPSSQPAVYVCEQPKEVDLLNGKVVYWHEAFYLWDSGHFAVASASNNRENVLNGDGVLFTYDQKGRGFRMGFFKRDGDSFVGETGAGSTYDTTTGRFSGDAILVDEFRQRYPVSWPAKLPDPIRYDPPIRYIRAKPLQPVPVPDWPPL